MKDLNLLIFLSQLGLSVVAPLAGLTLLGVWLNDTFGWGQWTVWTGLILGIVCAIEGLRSCLKVLSRMSSSKKDKDDPPTSFNDHQ